MILLASGGIALSVSSKPRGPGSLLPRESVVLWRCPETSKPGFTEAVQSKFEVVNMGGSNVEITSIESGCGCTKPRVEPKVIPPGRSGFVTFEAKPFPIGEKRVSIVLNTDSPKTPDVRLTLRMIGSRKPPFLLNIRGDLSYPNWEATKAPREIIVTTVEGLEMTNEPKPTCDLPQVRFERQSIDEQPYTTPDTVQRTYKYLALFDPAVDDDTVSGELRVVDPWMLDHIETLQVFVKSEPPIRVAPTLITLSAGGQDGQDGTKAEFLVITKGSSPRLTIRADSPESDFITIERLKEDSAGPVARFQARITRDSPAARRGGRHRFIIRDESSEAERIITIIARGDES